MSKLLAVFCINPLLFEKKRLILQRKGDVGQLSTKKIKTNKESEVIMSDYDLYTGREERMQAVIEAASASKESKINFLIDAGILEPSGELAPHLR
ncbi:MAG: hypothetical protein J6E48_12245 [Prevotella sp.]|nr:hypothetical protein [Prevotella sp.]